MSEFNFGDVFKNMGALRGQMEQMRERLGRLRITGEAGAGMVRVTVNGEGQVQNIEIDPGLLRAEEKDMLEELIISALNDASRRARESAAHELRNMAGVNIPGMEQLFGL